jgi:putative tryptophan/tyrosine transport system substrate-binding protein
MGTFGKTEITVPRARLTGVSFLALDLAAKRVAILKEAALSRIAVLSNPDHAGEPSELRVTREAARKLRLETA